MTKYAARGLTLEFEGEAITQVTQFGEVGSTRDLIDASAYGDDWKDYVLGQQDGDELDAVMAFDPANSAHDAIYAAYNDTPDDVFVWTLSHPPSGWAADVTTRIVGLRQGGQLGDLFQMIARLKIVNPGVELTGS